MDEYQTVSKFDRIVAGLMGGNTLKMKAATIEEIQQITGEAETFIIQTVRNEQGDNIIIKFVDKAGVVRLVLPPRVTDLIASHRASLTTRRRSLASKQNMQIRKERGEVIGFQKRKKGA